MDLVRYSTLRRRAVARPITISHGLSHISHRHAGSEVLHEPHLEHLRFLTSWLVYSRVLWLLALEGITQTLATEVDPSWNIKVSGDVRRHALGLT